MIQQRRNLGPLGPVNVQQPASVPPHVLATAREFKRDSAFLQGINYAVFPWSVAFTIDGAETLTTKGLEAEVLATSAQESWFGNPSPMSVQQLVANGPDQRRPEDFKDWVGRQNVLVMLRGKFPFVYEGKTVPVWPKEEDKDEKDAKEEKKAEEAPQQAALAEPKDSVVLVVGSQDFVKDEYLRFDQRLYAGNFIFLRNVVEAFSLSDELVAIRAKESSRRPLDASIGSGTRNFLKWFNVFGVPLLVAGAGILYALVRRGVSASFERRVTGSRRDARGAGAAA
jgi:hypothetical protein